MENLFIDYSQGIIYRFLNNKLKSYGIKEINRKYYEIYINGKTEKLHRVIYSNYNNIPLSTLGEIDHINQNKKDNSISNLREVSRSDNMLNRNKLSTNTSGYKNIHYHKIEEKYRFEICINGKKLCKRFNNIQDALIYRNEYYKKYPNILFGNL